MPPASFAWRSKCYPRSGRHTPSTWWQPHLYVTWVFVHAFCHDFGSLLLLPPCRRLAVRSLPRQNVSRGPFLQLMESIFHECERQAPPQLNAAASAALWAASEVGWLIGYCLHPRGCCLCLWLWHVRSLILFDRNKTKQRAARSPPIEWWLSFRSVTLAHLQRLLLPFMPPPVAKKAKCVVQQPRATPSSTSLHALTPLPWMDSLDHSCP